VIDNGLLGVKAKVNAKMLSVDWVFGCYSQKENG
jgi:hypothetical protein